MNIANNMVVGVHYQLEVDGNKIDASKEEPLVYLHGKGMMIPGFERQLEGLAEGAKYDFKVSPEEGYGSFNEEAIVDLDASIFKLDGTMSDQVFEGASLRMTSQDGAPMMGTVLKMTEDKVTMDFNHQLAGKELHFTGTVASVREATQEELDHGHVHGPGGHQH